MGLRVKIGAGVALTALVFLAGRLSAPAPSKTASAVAEKTTSLATSEATKSATVVIREVTKWRDRVVTKPDGTRIETHEAVRDEGRRDERREAARETKLKVEERERIVYRETAAARPDWSVGAAAGTGLDLKPRYQVGVARRLVGGLWLTVTADVTGRAAYAGLRFDF